MRHAVLLSGGVDSSTALAELVQAGHIVTAYYLKVWLEDELDYLGQCPWEEDLAYARAVCEQFGVELRVVPLQLDYYERVVSYALDELRAGRTPSPDIFCNERIKFGAFLDYLEREGGTGRVASGHYAQLRDRGSTIQLVQSPDPVKDQSYFLSHLKQEQLRRLVFPIGHLTKEAVRARAHEMNLVNRDRPDSQGICFLGKIRYPEFIRHYLGERPGRIVAHETGAVLGEHRGYWFHTIGQRTGLGLSGGPWYVVQKDVAENTIRVSHGHTAAASARSSFAAGDLSWTDEQPQPGRYQVKLRHGPSMVDASISFPDHDQMRVEMDEADRGVAPGQFAVIYRDSVCLGSGKIMDGAA